MLHSIIDGQENNNLALGFEQCVVCLVFFRVSNPLGDGPSPKNRHSVELFFIGETDPVLEKLVTWFKVYIF